MTAQGGEIALEYNEWIERERRIRVKLLRDSPLIREKKTYAVCQDCGEICLCHEDTCPNCYSSRIGQQKLDNGEVASGERIRCRFRFEHLTRGK